ncbi:MAG: hypothetical protein IMZ43_11475 [Thermoplasmata archaeon]|nr:hypothetical protein [Thermoplasmata archaeon]MBE3137993.1 hypothetical protein [Thermoplasmata archaeon]
MKKQKQFVLVGIMVVMLTTISLSGCTNAVDKSKFIGTWTTSGGDGTMTFNNDNNVTVTGQLGDISLSGTYTWAVAGEKITFTSGGSLGVTYDYRFPTANQLIFTNSNGGSVTLNKA